MTSRPWIAPTSWLGTAIDAVHKTLGSNEAAAKLATKIRNQMTMVIGKHLGPSCDSNSNGEFRLLEILKGEISCFVDIGANRGEWTNALLAHHPNATGYLYDPSRSCCTFLHTRFQNKNITIHEKALSNFEGEAAFAEERNMGETSSLNLQSTAPNAVIRRVNVSTLDQELGAHERCLDFVKIDAEGSDFQIIQGAHKLLTSRCIRWLQFEYNASWLDTGSSLKQALHYFNSIHFDLYLLNQRGLSRFDYQSWGDFYSYANFLAVRRDSTSPLRDLILPTASP
jgi:FkbM family methyltransferase